MLKSFFLEEFIILLFKINNVILSLYRKLYLYFIYHLDFVSSFGSLSVLLGICLGRNVWFIQKGKSLSKGE